MTEASKGTQPGVTEPERTHPIIQVENVWLRACTVYKPGTEPYDRNDSLGQKLWHVVNHEFGPNVADVLVSKLMRAVEHHITKVGPR